MQKNWYINQSGKNKGPFNAQDIIDFYDKGLIKSYQLCWKRGAKNWMPIFAVIEHARQEAEASDLGPQVVELPEIPVEEVESEVQEVSTQAILSADIEESVQDELLKDYIDESVDTDLTEHALPSKFPLYSTVLGVFFIGALIITSLYFFSGNELKQVEVKNVSVPVLNELKKEVSEGDIKLFPNKSMSALYAKLPFDNRVSVELTMSRKPDDIYSDELVISAHNVGEGGIILFDSFTFDKGSKFIEGSYRVTFIYELLGLEDTIKYKLGLSKIRKVIDKDIFIVTETREKYLSDINKRKAQKEKTSLDNLYSIKEKIQTLESIISSMSIHFRLSLGQKSGWLGHKEFKKRYTKHVGPLLQSIVLSNYELKKDTLSPQELQLENDIHNLGKEISAWSVKLTKKLSRYGTLNSKKKVVLRNFMDEDRTKFQVEKNKLQSRVNKLL